jgi:penicillin-binding protein 1A
MSIDIVKYFAASFLCVALLMAATLVGLLATLGKDLPSPQGVRDVEPSIATRILDRHGQLIDELYVEDRVPLHFSQIPVTFLQAVIAVEDRRFYQHWGIDPIGILRAARADFLRGSTTQGASTITQQLARNIFLHHRRTWIRKLQEAVLALRIERAFGKNEILELYVNKVYFGEGAYGLESAARRFCGVSAAKLSLNQCAMIAGLVGNPARFSPRRHPESCRWRRNVVLRSMLNTGVIDAVTYRLESAAPLALKGTPRPRPIQAAAEGVEPPLTAGATDAARRSGAYFTEAVRRQIAQSYGSSEIYHAGLTVETTLDLELQQRAEEILEAHLRTLEQRNDYPYLHGLPDSMLLPLGLPSAETLPAPLRLQGAMVAIEPATGAVRVLIGGRDFEESRYNRAMQGRGRQPASAFKPFIYAEAIRQGYRTTDILLDAPIEFENPGAVDEEGTWKPRNFSETYHGPVTLRYALMRSINVPTARLLMAIGPRAVVDLAHRMGVSSPLMPVPSLATGTEETTLLEMTNAYAVFANHGIRVDPFLVEQVFDKYGHTLETRALTSSQVLDEHTCYIVTNMLASAVERGTGQTARNIWRFHAPAAGKTGTNDDYTDAWFVGYTPDLVVGVWVGFDLKIPIGEKETGTGAMAALPIWAKFMKVFTEKYGSTVFEMPDGLVTAKTCEESGLLCTPACPQAVEDVFLPGTEPTEECWVHRGGPPRDGSFEAMDRQMLPPDRWSRHTPSPR